MPAGTRYTPVGSRAPHRRPRRADAWRDKRTKLYVFEAEVLEEKGLK
jgi:hypothetical protein